jgi:hypothetical protein
MPTIPLADIQRIENAGANAGNSGGTTLSAAGSANTKGSYSQLIATSSFPAVGILISFSRHNAGGSGFDYLVDIAIGAAASEHVIISNLVSSGGAEQGTYTYFFPCSIPAGSRISARIQSTTASVGTRINCLLLGGGFAQAEQFSGVDTYGANTTDSGGTSVDPGGAANTKGSYVEISSSTNHKHHYIVVGIGLQTNIIRTTGSWLMDIAIGALGSEQIIVPDIDFSCHSLGSMITPYAIVIPIQVPAGSRIAVRLQSSITDASDRLMDVVIYGVF